MNYAVLFVVIVLAIVAGQMLTQSWLLAQARHRRKHARQHKPAPKPKPEPQKIKFNMMLSGVDDVEAGLARVEAALMRIAEAADGVPITINNYYNTPEKVEEE